jgi:hypothetical protein
MEHEENMHRIDTVCTAVINSFRVSPYTIRNDILRR